MADWAGASIVFVASLAIPAYVRVMTLAQDVHALRRRIDLIEEQERKRRMGPPQTELDYSQRASYREWRNRAAVRGVSTRLDP